MTEVTIKLPRAHPTQRQVIDDPSRYKVLECGRRYGKTVTGEIAACEAIVKGWPVAWFAPTYKYLAEPWRDIERMLKPIISRVRTVEQRIEFVTGGSLDFWSLDKPDAGRGRKYKLVLIDEASIARNLQECWQQAIRPTLTDLEGGAYFQGTPKGRNFFHQLFSKGESNEPGWKSWRLPTVANPYIKPAEVEAARRELPPHVFEQEYLGIPADDGGNPFGLAAIRACITKLPSMSGVVAYGVDLAKSQDWTWIIGLDESAQEVTSERWQSDWGQTRARLVQTIGRTPAMVDSTGVGDPIVEDLQRQCPAVQSFKFTRQSKQQLMEGLASAIQRHVIHYTDPLLISELETFEYEYTENGVRYTAPSGLHDDGVCSLALAYRCLSERGKTRTFYSRSDITVTDDLVPAGIPIDRYFDSGDDDDEN